MSWPNTEDQPGAGGAGEINYTTSADECTQDADCEAKARCELVHTNARPLGGCMNQVPVQEVPDYARLCIAGCTEDSDCQQHEICECGDPIGRCVASVSRSAGCRTDADCAEGALCLQNARGHSLDAVQWACQLPGDSCSSDSDCGGDFCLLSTEGRSCEAGVVCGRPFLIQDEARCAEATATRSWLWVQPSPGPGVLEEHQAASEALDVPDGELAQALVQHWTQVGLMEHASVAAFARFALQLMSLGAPAELVVACAGAQLDEARHAGLAFGLASRYRGTPVGPGPLPLHHAFDDTSWEDILIATIREGCVGETRAALEASQAALDCQDASVRETLLVIAHDESVHAELAWRAVAWMLEKRPDLAGAAQLEFARAVASVPLDPTRPSNAREYGVLSCQELAACYRAANDDVVRPCSEALFARFLPTARRSVDSAAHSES